MVCTCMCVLINITKAGEMVCTCMCVLINITKAGEMVCAHVCVCLSERLGKWCVYHYQIGWGGGGGGGTEY